MQGNTIIFTVVLIASVSTGLAESFPIRTLSDIGQRINRENIQAGSQAGKPVNKTMISLDRQEITDALSLYLTEKYQEDFEIELDSLLSIPEEWEGKQHDFALENVHINDNRSRLRAELAFSGQPDFSLTVTARISALIDVPVLARPVKQGQMIAAEDIIWQKLPERRLRGRIITSQDDVVGYQPRARTLASNEPIRKNDLFKPALVKKGSLVLAYIDNQGVAIQMQAKALDGGSIGEKVRVQNPESSKILYGTIEASGNVRILTATAYASVKSGVPDNVN